MDFKMTLAEQSRGWGKSTQESNSPYVSINPRHVKVSSTLEQAATLSLFGAPASAWLWAIWGASPELVDSMSLFNPEMTPARCRKLCRKLCPQKTWHSSWASIEQKTQVIPLLLQPCQLTQKSWGCQLDVEQSPQQPIPSPQKLPPGHLTTQ